MWQSVLLPYSKEDEEVYQILSRFKLFYWEESHSWTTLNLHFIFNISMTTGKHSYLIDYYTVYECLPDDINL